MKDEIITSTKCNQKATSFFSSSLQYAICTSLTSSFIEVIQYSSFLISPSERKSRLQLDLLLNFNTKKKKNEKKRLTEGFSDKYFIKNH